MSVNKKDLVLLCVAATLSLMIVGLVIVLITLSKDVAVAPEEMEPVTESADISLDDINYVTEVTEVSNTLEDKLLEDMNYYDAMDNYAALLGSTPIIVDQSFTDGHDIIMTFPNVDATFTVSLDDEDNVIKVGNLINSVNSKYPVVSFLQGIPENSKAIYKVMSEAGLKGIFETDYAGGDTLEVMNVETGSFVSFNLNIGG